MKTSRTIPRLLLLLLAIWLAGAVTARADLVITFQPASPNPINAGSTGFVDVLIHSDAGDKLSGYLADFTITGGTGLNFTNPQSDSYVNDPNYVFSGPSSDRLTDNPSSVNEPLYTDTILNASTNSNGYVQLSLTDMLLARLELTAAANAATASYVISLDNLQLFTDENGDPINYAAASGNVDVQGISSAVPEPSSLVLGLTALCGAMFFRRRIESQRHLSAIQRPANCR